MAEFYSARGSGKSRRFRGLICHRRIHSFDRGLQLAELDYLFSSDAAQAALAENYVGPAL